MSFCTQCGKQNANNSKFCAFCGSAVSNTREQISLQQAAHQTPKMQLHCPRCKSEKITITTESSIDAAVTTATGNLATTAFSNTHRNFWICCKCGTKFRNIQNLEEELNKIKNQPLAFGIASIIMTALILFFVIKFFSSLNDFYFDFDYSVYLYAIFGFALIPADIFAIYKHYSYKKMNVQMKEELAYLKYNCFN